MSKRVRRRILEFGKITAWAAMGILLNPELERRIALKIESGRYSSADQVIEHGLDLLEASEGGKEPRTTPEPIWEMLVRLGGQIPDEELANIPTDLAQNHDHYLYGSPKEPE